MKKGLQKLIWKWARHFGGLADELFGWEQGNDLGFVPAGEDRGFYVRERRFALLEESVAGLQDGVLVVVHWEYLHFSCWGLDTVSVVCKLESRFVARNLISLQVSSLFFNYYFSVVDYSSSKQLLPAKLGGDTE